MGEIHDPDPVLLIVAASSRHDAALAWARERIEQSFGPLALVSDAFAFTQTDYYAAAGGRGCKEAFPGVGAPRRPARGGGAQGGPHQPAHPLGRPEGPPRIAYSASQR